jgi:hypothetical protein
MPTAAQNPKAETAEKGPASRSSREPATLQEAANLFWDSLLAKCGGDYYDNGEYSIVQWRDASFHVLPETLSAEKLSRVQWKGWGIMTAALIRDFHHTDRPRWSDWGDGTPLNLKSGIWRSFTNLSGAVDGTLSPGRLLNGDITGWFVVYIEKSAGPAMFYYGDREHGTVDSLPKKLSCAAIPK